MQFLCSERISIFNKANRARERERRMNKLDFLYFATKFYEKYTRVPILFCGYSIFKRKFTNIGYGINYFIQEQMHRTFKTIFVYEIAFIENT